MRTKALLLATCALTACLYDVHDVVTLADGGDGTGDAPADQAADAPDAFMCSLTTCGGDCADLMTNGKHCGQCGHDCEGGACAMGKCAPVALATGQSPDRIAIDATNVYWINGGGSIMECAIAGCANKPTTLVSGQSGPFTIAADGTDVYWTNYVVSGTVAKCARTGCSGNPTILAGGLNKPRGLAIDATSVYWSNSDAGSVMKCAKGGCGGNPTTLASGLAVPVRDVAVDGKNVYWTTAANGSIGACPIGGGSPASFPQESPNPIVSDGTNLFWTVRSATAHLVATCILANCAGTVSWLALSSALADNIAIDATNVYWTNQTDNTVMTCPKGGGTLKTISNQGIPKGIAVDTKRIFWADQFDGTIMKLVKP